MKTMCPLPTPSRLAACDSRVCALDSETPRAQLLLDRLLQTGGLLHGQGEDCLRDGAGRFVFPPSRRTVFLGEPRNIRGQLADFGALIQSSVNKRGFRLV